MDRLVKSPEEYSEEDDGVRDPKVRAMGEAARY